MTACAVIIGFHPIENALMKLAVAAGKATTAKAIKDALQIRFRATFIRAKVSIGLTPRLKFKIIQNASTSRTNHHFDFLYIGTKEYKNNVGNVDYVCRF